MTVEQIEEHARRQAVRFGLAADIRRAIDDAWDEEALTDEVLEMVMGEPS